MYSVKQILPQYKQGSPKDSYIPAVVFRTFCFSLNLTGTLNLTKIVHYHWSRMGKYKVT